MSRKTYLTIAAGIVLALLLVFNFTGVLPGKEGASGTLSCSSPTGPNESDNREYYPQEESERIPTPSKQADENIAMQLLVGPIEYAEEIGGEKWRAGFEVKVYFQSGRDITKESDITFYSMQKAIKPSPEDDWTPIKDIYAPGLMSVEGPWLHREGSYPTIWVRAHIRIPEYDLDADLIGEAMFREDEERPTSRWSSISVGSGGRILDSMEFVLH